MKRDNPRQRESAPLRPRVNILAVGGPAYRQHGNAASSRYYAVYCLTYQKRYAVNHRSGWNITSPAENNQPAHASGADCVPPDGGLPAARSATDRSPHRYACYQQQVGYVV